MTVCDEGETLSVKSGGGALTVKLAVAVRVRPPPIPLTVKVTVPVGVVSEVLTRRATVPGEAGLGVKLQLAPLGKPLQERVTWPLNPLIEVMVTV